MEHIQWRRAVFRNSDYSFHRHPLALCNPLTTVPGNVSMRFYSWIIINRFIILRSVNARDIAEQEVYHLSIRFASSESIHIVLQNIWISGGRSDVSVTVVVQGGRLYTVAVFIRTSLKNIDTVLQFKISLKASCVHYCLAGVMAFFIYYNTVIATHTSCHFVLQFHSGWNSRFRVQSLDAGVFLIVLQRTRVFIHARILVCVIKRKQNRRY